jgi:hypothetical protein
VVGIFALALAKWMNRNRALGLVICARERLDQPVFLWCTVITRTAWLGWPRVRLDNGYRHSGTGRCLFRRCGFVAWNVLKVLSGFPIGTHLFARGPRRCGAETPCLATSRRRLPDIGCHPMAASIEEHFFNRYPELHN